jgi:hypothetical protein
MDEIIEMLHEYVSLLARVTSGDALCSVDRARWLALSRLIPGTGEPPEPSDNDQAHDGVPVQVTAPGGFESARLLAVSRDGMRLCLSHPLPQGLATIVRAIAPRSGFEYTFPCKVAWSREESVGLAFDGAPKKLPLSKALLVGWRRPIDLRTGWGLQTPLAQA